MRLIKVILNGFRSFGSETSIDIDELTAFIGGNGVGKTSVLLALNRMFSSNASDRIVKSADFFISSEDEDEPPLSRKLSCEAVFELDSDGTASNRNAASTFFSHLTVGEEGAKPILRIRLVATWNAQGPADGTIDSKIYYVVSPLNSSVEEETLAETTRLDLNNIRMIYVPAVRDPDRQLGRSSTGILKKLINNIIWDKETKETIPQFTIQVQHLSD